MTLTQTVTVSLLLLARLGGILIYVPIPGAKSAPLPARVFLVVSLSLALLPSFLQSQAPPAGLGQLTLWLVGEMAFGLMVGLLISFLAEGLAFGLQAIAIQAGFSYSSTIDPNSEADSGVLQTIAQVTANLLFFQLGGDVIVIRAFARSLHSWPPGSASLGWPAVESIAAFSGAMLDLGLRLALPIAALLFLTDLSLALMARLQSQLQLLSLAFPVKMLATLAFLSVLIPVVPILYRTGLQMAVGHLGRLIR